MRRPNWIWIIPLAIVAFCALGMGDLGGASNQTPRRPARNFTGTVTDRSQQTLSVQHIHCEGKTNIKGYLGDMRLELSFDQVQSVDFSRMENGFVNGQVGFRDGQSKNLRFKGLTRCYGESDMGKMMIKLADVKRIEFGPPPPAEEEKPALAK